MPHSAHRTPASHKRLSLGELRSFKRASFLLMLKRAQPRIASELTICPAAPHARATRTIPSTTPCKLAAMLSVLSTWMDCSDGL